MGCKLTHASQALAQGVLITRAKNLPAGVGATGSKQEIYVPVPALKVCLTVGLSRKEVEKTGITIRHAITKVLTRKR
jgi:serine palmitoyltransferase